MKQLILFLVVFLLVGGYLYYVRGFGVPPHASRPAVLEQGGAAKTYAWVSRAAMPTARSEITAAVLEGKIHVIGGFDGFGRTLATVEIYDPERDSWRNGPTLPDGRHHAAAVTAGNSLYLIGGYSGLGFKPKTDVFQLAAGAGSWQRVASLPAARGAMAAAAVDGKIHVVAGVGPEGLSADLFVYDPQRDRWERKAPAPTRRDHLTAGAMKGLLYVAGGREKTLSSNLPTLEIYDPAGNAWRPGPPMPTPRGGVAGAILDGLFVVVGGEQPTSTHPEVEAFDPEKNRWTSLPALPTPRHGLAAVTVGNSLYAIGGGKKPALSVSSTNEALHVY